MEEALAPFNLQEATPVSTPTVDLARLERDESSERTNAPYRAAIGTLLYLALNTRPDILFPTIALCHNNDPRETHWAAVKRIFRYVSGTKTLALTFNPTSNRVEIDAYADADWVGYRTIYREERL